MTRICRALIGCCALAGLPSACAPYGEGHREPPVPYVTPEVIVDPTAPDGGRLYMLLQGTAGSRVETYGVQQEQMLEPIPLEGQPVAIAVDRVDGEIASADPYAGLVRRVGREVAVGVVGATDLVYTPRIYTCCGPEFLLFAAGADGVAGLSRDSFSVDDEYRWVAGPVVPTGNASAVAVSPDGLRVAAAFATTATNGAVALLETDGDVELHGAAVPMMTVDSCGGRADAIALTETHLVAWDASCDAIHELDLTSLGWRARSIPTDGVRPADSRSALAVTHGGTTALVLTSSAVWGATVGGIAPAFSLGAVPGRTVAVSASLGDRAWVAWQDGTTPHVAAIDLVTGSLSTSAGFDAGTGEVLDLVYRDLPPEISIGNRSVLAGDVVELDVSLWDPDGDEIDWGLHAPYDAVPDVPGRTFSYRSRCSKRDSTVPINAYAQAGKLRVPYSGHITVKGRTDCRTRAKNSEVSGAELSCNAHPEPSGVGAVPSMLPMLAVAVWLAIRRARECPRRLATASPS